MRGETSILGGPKPFPTTHWSLVLGGRAAAESARRAGLDTLCRKYWSPVYFTIRRHWNRSVEEAKDLTQSFFAAFLEKDFLRSVDASRGKFRSFLCAALHHFLCKQARFDAAQKRTPQPPPPEDFDADWKRALVQAAIDRLRAGGNRWVELLVRYDLDPDPRPSYEELSREFGLTVSQVTNGLHAARRAFKQACLDEVRETVTSEEEFAEESERLFGRGT